MIPESSFSDDDIKKRFLSFYGENSFFNDTEMLPCFRNKWSSISKYMQEIKQTFSRYFNKRHKRRGTLWGERFKSVIVENGETRINRLAYVELNPVHANIVDRPDMYY
ncbi:MAG: transposase [Proteobacteria bacterium]|nr:transposase [Pseudomonadota bacterium]